MGRVQLRYTAILVLSFMPFVSGCDQKAEFDKLVPKEEAAFAEHYLQQLAAGNLDAAEADLDPRLMTTRIRSELAVLAESFPKTSPKSVTLIGSHTVAREGFWQGQFTFQYEYPEYWLLAGVAMHRSDTKLLIDGVNVEQALDSVENKHRFSLLGKTWQHYGVLIGVSATFLFVLHSLWQCLRDSDVEHRWFLAALILLGFGMVEFNWTTGTFDFVPLQALFFGVGFQKLLYAAPIVKLGIPVGAIGFKMLRYAQRFSK